jgi:hypothetical protein
MEWLGANAVAHNWCGLVAVRLRFTGHPLAHAMCPDSVQTLDVNRREVLDHVLQKLLSTIGIVASASQR